MMGPDHVGPGHVHCGPIVPRPESQREHPCSEQEWGRRSEQGCDTASNASCHALCRVPAEVVEGSIAPHLTASDLCAMAAVCRCWHRVASSDSLWQQRCESTFPCHPAIAASGEIGGGEGRGDGGGGGGRGGSGGESARWKGLFGALVLARAQWGGGVERLVARGVDCSSEWGEWRVQGIGCGGDGGIWCSEPRTKARRAAESKRHGKACGGAEGRAGGREGGRAGEFVGVALAHPLCAVAGVVVTPAPLYGSSRASHMQVQVGFSATSFHYTSPPIRLSSDWLQPHTLALPPAALVAGSHLRIYLTGLSPLTACQPAAAAAAAAVERVERELVLAALQQQPCFHAAMARWVRPRAGEPLDAAEVIMALRHSARLTSSRWGSSGCSSRAPYDYSSSGSTPGHHQTIPCSGAAFVPEQPLSVRVWGAY
ncbi:unnamed protein product [Closterium sp. Naga37s-1]|nr:unnamed protein product [Closterium sp. Naga37s-1]